VNVSGGQAHSICHQFLDPFYNRRSDEYGGSLRNRARFWLEAIEVVREAVGDDCAITARVGHEVGRRGVTIEEACEFVSLADELVDLWDLTISNVLRWSEDVGPSRSHKENFQHLWAEALRPWTKKPIVGVGRLVSPDLMAQIVRDGQLDMIGAARPSIADPFLPSKIEAGRTDEIRECIGCNVCISRIWGVGSRLICTQNPTAGEEFRRGWHPEKFTRARNSDQTVLVIGAGPAGLECATVLGKRGISSVHLVEAGQELGGIMRWIPKLPGLGEWGRVVDYRKSQLKRLRNVSVITGERLDADTAATYGADLIVVATGSTWALDGTNNVDHGPIAGADGRLSWQYTPEQLIDQGKEVTGDSILVYDCEGYFMGASIAERLAQEGHRVRLVCPADRAAEYTRHTGEWYSIAASLDQLGVEIETGWRVVEIAAGKVAGARTDLEHRRCEWEADGVVLVTQRNSDRQLWDDLTRDPGLLAENEVSGAFQIGDCVVPRFISEAIFDGHRLAREIDSDEPSVALPYAREGATS
jgi:dimethylamine/trimethylamine dehydrogenase